MRRWISIFFIGILLTLPPTVRVAAADPPAGEARSIILLVGDGMGANQVLAAGLYAEEATGYGLAMDGITDRSVTLTRSNDSEVTDSAAAMSAIMSGHKFNNGAINTLPDGTITAPLSFAARDAGKAIGVVSTTRLTHATPATVYAQTQTRDAENAIAEQLLSFAPEVALGGGRSRFIPQAESGSARTDDRDLTAEAQDAGYTYVTSAGAMQEVDPAAAGKLLGLFSPSHMSYEVDRQTAGQDGDEPSLAEMTGTAIRVLERDDDGFFLVVEGGRIDHACHAHDIKAAIMETIAFDEAVRVALDYAAGHPDILVVVTADHETGGLMPASESDSFNAVSALQGIASSIEHLGRLIEANPDQAVDIVEHGLGVDLPTEDEAMLRWFQSESAPDVVESFAGGTVDEAQALSAFEIGEYTMTWEHSIMEDLEAGLAQIEWTTYYHTAQPVFTFAAGPAAVTFTGYYENTDLAWKMAAALGLNMPP